MFKVMILDRRGKWRRVWKGLHPYLEQVKIAYMQRGYQVRVGLA